MYLVNLGFWGGYGHAKGFEIAFLFFFWKQESKMIDQTSGRFDGKTKLWYKCELEQDVSHSDPSLASLCRTYL